MIPSPAREAVRRTHHIPEASPSDGAGGSEDVPYDIDGYLIAIDTEKIDVDYMNSRFEKYLKMLHQQGASASAMKQAEDELHKT